MPLEELGVGSVGLPLRDNDCLARASLELLAVLKLVAHTRAHEKPIEFVRTLSGRETGTELLAVLVPF